MLRCKRSITEIFILLKAEREDYEERGNFVLEIPKSNENFSSISEYVKLAEDNGVTIVFKPE